MNELAALWERFRGVTYEDLPDEIRLLGKQCILDWTGVALYGSTEPLAEILREEFATKDDAATLLNTSQRASAPIAALINGAAGHALDFDDTNTPGGGHWTSAILPAALAVGETRGVSGSDLLTAFVVGTEVGLRMRWAIGTEPYEAGWHMTSGVYGALGAAGRMMGIDADQFLNAVGIGAATSSGVQANFGSMTKPFHAGLAAEAGVRAAALAARGFTAGSNAWEQKTSLMSGVLDWESIRQFDDAWMITNTYFKRYASGAGCQSLIDGTQRLGVTADEVIWAEVRVSPHVLESGYAQFPVATRGYQAKFSPTSAMALTLLGHNMSDPLTFSDENVNSSEFKELVAKIKMVEDPDKSTQGNEKLLVFETTSGTKSELVGLKRDAGPAAERTAQLRAKFDTLAGAVIGERSKALGDMILDLESVPSVSKLTELTRR